MFEDIKNNIDFFIRNNTKFSRKNFNEKSQEKLHRNYLENLYTLDVLEQFLEKTDNKEAKILDIGCKNWFYAKGEYEFFQKFCQNFTLDGIEIDAHRLYSNFYSRYETAKFYIKNLKNTNYIIGNLLDLEKQYDYIIWFLPFILEEPHLMWGLPKKLFYPEKLIKHAYSLLKQNGQMLIINQGEIEFQEQKNFLNNLNIKYEEKGIVKKHTQWYNVYII